MKQRMIISMPLLLLAVLLNAQVPTVKELDAYVKKVMTTFQVPDLSLAIVKDGKIILTKGYGLRTLGAEEKTDEKTLFGIASNTKAFTATALALLVDEGKLEWDKPVIDYLPWFRLADPWITSQITVRDLLVHHSGLGLGAGDLLLWPATTYTRREIAERLKNVPLTGAFRSSYAYDNVLYLVAGVLIEEVAGCSWEEFIQARIFTPLGMNRSTPSIYNSDDGNIASTHAFLQGTLQVVPHDTGSNPNPAGGIGSCASDLAIWMRVQLDSGRIDANHRLFSPTQTKELWTPVTPMPVSQIAPLLNPAQSSYKGYALGFRVMDYRTKETVSHTGTLTGYVSRIFMIPEIKLGIAVLTNQEAEAAYESIIYYLADRYLKAPPYNWLGAYQGLKEAKDSGSLKSAVRIVNKDSTSGPSVPLSALAGKYQDSWYGDVEISFNEDQLLIQFMQTPQLRGYLQHWQYDTFVARWDQRDLRADAFVTFDLNPEGKVEKIRMKALLPDTDFSYDYQDLDLRPLVK